MDLQNIQDQLNTEFAKSETRIIFWFDDKGEYEDEVSELQLGDVKRHILDGTNWLYSKYLLNEEDKESKYLVYAAFAKPSDAENPLADIVNIPLLLAVVTKIVRAHLNTKFPLPFFVPKRSKISCACSSLNY